MRTRVLPVVVTIVFMLLVQVPPAGAQTAGETYQRMSAPDQSAFISEQARRIAREISGREYEFTPAFLELIQKNVDS
jgi:hypothetical protein